MHIIKDAEYSLATVSVCVFDEADRLFEMGFAEQLTEIVKSMSDTGVRQTMLFSATLPSVCVTILIYYVKMNTHTHTFHSFFLPFFLRHLLLLTSDWIYFVFL